MSKLSKSEKVEGAITAEDTELKKRAHQALAAGYSLVAVDSQTLLDCVEERKSYKKLVCDLYNYFRTKSGLKEGELGKAQAIAEEME
jgi:hypothetical protein